MKRPVILVVACVLASATCWPLRAARDLAPGPRDARPHLEVCTRWSERDGSFGFINECREPVALLFVQLNGEHRFDRVVRPKERFELNLPEQKVNETGWLFTACPAGYVPNMPFTAEHQLEIVMGQYECVRK